ncbi:MAG: hypothetical protein QOJ73_5004 [Streptosporangiaceae bacterium]|jgi:hypothetical protein|nr:hypothetical protein [Streptosporangiaceae bacterium]
MIANAAAISRFCEEDTLSIHKIIARPSSGVTRSFTIIELKNAEERKPEPGTAESAAPAKE